MPVLEALRVPSSPVDLRLWIRNVLLNRQTVADAQADLDADPMSYDAQRIQALSLTAGLVYTLLTQPSATPRKLLILTHYRDVVIELYEHWRHAGVQALSLYSGTPTAKREKILMRFQYLPDHSVLMVHLKDRSLDLSLPFVDAVVVLGPPEEALLQYALGWVPEGVRTWVVEGPK